MLLNQSQVGAANPNNQLKLRKPSSQVMRGEEPQPLDLLNKKSLESTTASEPQTDDSYAHAFKGGVTAALTLVCAGTIAVASAPIGLAATMVATGVSGAMVYRESQRAGKLEKELGDEKEARIKLETRLKELEDKHIELKRNLESEKENNKDLQAKVREETKLKQEREKEILDLKTEITLKEKELFESHERIRKLEELQRLATARIGILEKQLEISIKDGADNKDKLTKLEKELQDSLKTSKQTRLEDQIKSQDLEKKLEAAEVKVALVSKNSISDKSRISDLEKGSQRISGEIEELRKKYDQEMCLRSKELQSTVEKARLQEENIKSLSQLATEMLRELKDLREQRQADLKTDISTGTVNNAGDQEKFPAQAETTPSKAIIFADMLPNINSGAPKSQNLEGKNLNQSLPGYRRKVGE